MIREPKITVFDVLPGGRCTHPRPYRSSWCDSCRAKLDHARMAQRRRIRRRIRRRARRDKRREARRRIAAQIAAAAAAPAPTTAPRYTISVCPDCGRQAGHGSVPTCRHLSLGGHAQMEHLDVVPAQALIDARAALRRACVLWGHPERFAAEFAAIDAALGTNTAPDHENEENAHA